jgi:N-acetylglucosamine kinase-like BadF-type ATPase
VTSPNDDLVIGVDGGGTKTVAWVAPRNDPTNTIVLGRGQAGPGNPRAVGFKAAQLVIGYAIAQALTAAGRSRDPVAAACLCLAGAGREPEQRRMVEWARRSGVATRARVTGDAEPILAAASAENWGIALIGGTGSLAWGRSREGQTARTGGWGYLLGDEGSAYAIAVAALRAATQAADGRAPHTILLPRLMHRLNATEPSDLIEKVYDADLTRDQIAALAVSVFDAASEQDFVADQIISTAADDLATMVATLAQRLGLAGGTYPLAITGSVLLQQEPYRQRLLERLAVRSAAPATVQLVTDAVAGSVVLARQAAQSPAAAG